MRTSWSLAGAPAAAALAVLLAAGPAPLPAQPQQPDPAARARWAAELDRDVWQPYLRGVRGDSAPLYVGVLARDFHRVAPGERGRIMDRAEYDLDSRRVMARRQAEGATTEIDVRFLERNLTATFAVEKVVMRYAIRRPGREPEVGFGIVHYFSRREAEGWRVVLRFGSPERATEATFAAATPLVEEGAGR